MKGDPAKLIEEKKYKQFYMHGLGHFLGIDVHDVGNYYFNGESRGRSRHGDDRRAGNLRLAGHQAFPKDSIRTFRNNIWASACASKTTCCVTENGPRVLTTKVPKDADEIEALMAK